MTQFSEYSILEITGRCIIDIMKENMINERRRNEEFVNFLKCQVENYIIELSHKNEQISCLMKLLENNNVNTHKHQVETIPIHRCPTDLASNNRE